MTDTAAVPTIPSPVPGDPTGDGAHPEYDKQGFLIRGAQPTRMEAFVDAAFAFAVTLLVVSVGHVPDSMGDLLNAMRGVPAFAASFIIIARIWHEHWRWSQRFALEDGPTIRLSLALVFVVLLYVYPLRMMFSMAFGALSHGLLTEHAVEFRSLFDVRALYLVYAVGYGVVALIIAQLNRHALAQAQALDLSARERARTSEVVLRWRAMAGVALFSILLAMVLPIGKYGGWLAAIPGLAYVLIWPVDVWVKRRATAALVALGRPGHG